MSMSTSLALHNLNNLKFEAASTSSPGSILALLQQHIGSWREGPDSSLYCSILRCGIRNKERCISLMEVSWIWRLLSHGVPKGSSCLARDRIQVMTTDSEQLASMHPTTNHQPPPITTYFINALHFHLHATYVVCNQPCRQQQYPIQQQEEMITTTMMIHRHQSISSKTLKHPIPSKTHPAASSFPPPFLPTIPPKKSPIISSKIPKSSLQWFVHPPHPCAH